MTVGEKIYTLRVQAGYSQEEFAEVIGVSRQSVSKWETSLVMPDTEYIVQICKVLAISTDTLLLDKDLPKELKTAQNKETQSSNGRAVLTITRGEEVYFDSANNVNKLAELAEMGVASERDSADSQFEANKGMSIAGFVLSFFSAIIGLILSCIVVHRERHLPRINHLAVSGVAISCVQIYARIIYAVVYGTLSAAFGGVL